MNLFELYHKYMTTRQDRAYYDLTVACHIKNVVISNEIIDYLRQLMSLYWHIKCRDYLSISKIY